MALAVSAALSGGCGDAALQGGKTEAIFYLGLPHDWYSYPEEDYEKAKAYYEAAEGQEQVYIASAMHGIGYLYHRSSGEEQDYDQAMDSNSDRVNPKYSRPVSCAAPNLL